MRKKPSWFQGPQTGTVTCRSTLRLGRVAVKREKARVGSSQGPEEQMLGSMP